MTIALSVTPAGILGLILVAISGALIFSALSALWQRRKAEQYFLAAVARNLGNRWDDPLDGEFLERAEAGGELDQKTLYYLSPTIYETVRDLDPHFRQPISRALRQPSERGRYYYVQKILTESAKILRTERERVSSTNDRHIAGPISEEVAYPPVPV